MIQGFLCIFAKSANFCRQRVGAILNGVSLILGYLVVICGPPLEALGPRGIKKQTGGKVPQKNS